MSQMLSDLGMLIGGLGLFMLAVGMISDGLRLSAGKTLRHILSRWTSTPLHGLVSGIAITTIVQSSSAVTVATIGFVNSGLMTLYQSLGVVFGANIGTTVTGWLVAMIGFKFKVELFALPLIGMGMFLRLIAGQRRIAHWGWVLVGFGLFFIGVDLLRGAFEGLAKGIDFDQFSSDGVSAVLLFLGIGVLITVLTQSSSAAMAIILTAAGGQVVELPNAAAMVIGANLGTTSTALIAVIGATANAKRVAAAHVFFNLITAVTALLMLPLIFWLVAHTGQLFGFHNRPEITLALFHTTFNILGVLLVWPLLGWLTTFLEKRFITQQEIESRPKYLDKNVAVSPALALNALTLEIDRTVKMTKGMIKAVLDPEQGSKWALNNNYATLEKLTNRIGEFISTLEKGTLSNIDVKDQLSILILTQQYNLSSANRVLEVAQLQGFDDELLTLSLKNSLETYQMTMRDIVIQLSEQVADESTMSFNEEMQQIKQHYDQMKALLVDAAVDSSISIHMTIELMDNIKKVQLMAEQFCKASNSLNQVKTYLLN